MRMVVKAADEDGIRVTVQTREDKCRRIGRENVDSVSLGRTAAAALMSPTPYLAEERPKKKRPTHSIGSGITEEATMSRPAVLDTVFQRQTAAAAMAVIRHGEGQKVGTSTKRK